MFGIESKVPSSAVGTSLAYDDPRGRSWASSRVEDGVQVRSAISAWGAWSFIRRTACSQSSFRR